MNRIKALKNIAIGLASFSAISSLQAQDPSLLAHWQFDDIGGFTAVDNSIYQRDLSLSGGANMVDAGLFGGSLSLNGGGAIAQYTADDVQQLTVTFYMNLDELPAEPWQEGVISPRIFETRGYAIFVSGEGPSLVFEYRYDSYNESKWRVSLDRDNIVDAWTHVAITFDKNMPNTAPKIFINGDRASDVTQTEMPTGNPISNEGEAYIGNRYEGDRGFNGFLDEIRIYNRVLTASEVEEIIALAGVGEFARFFPDAEAREDGWYESEWFGWMMPHEGVWVYHIQHGWIALIESTDGGIWFYDMSTFDNEFESLGYLYTSEELHPWFYSTEREEWLMLQEGSMNPRWFYGAKSEEWFQAN